MVLEYEEMIRRLGVPKDLIEEVTLGFGDVVPQPDGELVVVHPSHLHGYGVWGKGTRITVYKGGNRTLAGRFLNHGETTGSLVIEGADVVLYPDDTEGELFIDYWQALHLLNQIGEFCGKSTNEGPHGKPPKQAD